MQKFITIVAISLFSFSAFSLTLIERKKQAEWQEEIKTGGYSTTFKSKCGYDMPLTMEEKFVTPFMAANTSAPSYCDSTRSAMSSMCDDKLSKEAITQKIKKVECKLGAKGQKDLKLNGTTLVFTVGLDASNLDDAVKTFLEHNL